MPITTVLGPVPSATGPTNFDAKADAFLPRLDPWALEVNAVEANITDKEGNAAVSALSASISAAAAAASSSVSMWVSGSYAAGVCVWSPADKQTYRKNTTGSTSTDPSADAANWTRLTYTGQILNQAAGTSVAGVYGNDYALNNVAASVVTLPATPSAGAAPIGAIPCNSLTTNYFARNGSLIHGRAEDFYMSSPERTYYATYINATVGWRIK